MKSNIGIAISHVPNRDTGITDEDLSVATLNLVHPKMVQNQAVGDLGTE